MTGTVYVGVGGWTFEPWRGTFYPPGLPHKRELEYASRKLSSIEINGTYYSTFKPESWTKWRSQIPDGFVFSVKGSRFCTNRRQLASAADAAQRFVGQGLGVLRERLGPINWQLTATKPFDHDDIASFLALLPREVVGVKLRHALEVRHPGFQNPQFYALARRHNVAIVFADSDGFPIIEEQTADFSYARLMRTKQTVTTGYAPAALTRWAKRAKAWAAHGVTFVYFISGAKVRNPAAAQAQIARLRRAA
jgi:uncharacterized protein YecE (DUF72 family)